MQMLEFVSKADKNVEKIVRETLRETTALN